MDVPVRTRWDVVLASVLGGVVAALHIGKMAPALPSIQAELGLSLVDAGFVVSMFNVLGMALALFVGAATERLGRRALMAGGFLLMAAGDGLGAMADGLPLLLAGRFIEGVGFIGTGVAAPALVLAAASPHDRPLALGLWSVFMPAGMALALLLAPPVLGHIGWRGMWLGIGGLTLLTMVVVAATTRGLARPEPASVQPWRLAWQTLARPGLLLLGLVFVAYSFQWVTVMVWLPTFLSVELAASTLAASQLTALVVIINVPSNILGGWLLRHRVPRPVLVVGGAFIMGLCGWGIFSPEVADPLRYALCLLFSFAGGFIPASLFAAVPVHAPSPGHMAAANGLLMQGSNVGQFVGPPLVAAAVAAAGGAWTGAAAPLLAGAAIAVIAGITVGRIEARL